MRRLRLLWVTPHLPRRGVTAARGRWWSLLARLAPRHDVTLLAFVDAEDAGAVRELPPGLAAVRTVPRAPWVPDDPLALLPGTVRGGFAHPALGAAVAAALAETRPDLVQYEYTEMGAVMPPAAVPSLLTVAQLGFAAHRPAWRAAGGGLRAGAVALFRHLRDLDWELRALRRVHHVVTMTPEDAARLRRFLPDLRVSVSPVGVDSTHFRPPPAAPPPAVDLLFVGHFGHPPNVDAARLLVREVLPRLGPGTRLRLIGRALPAEAAALARAAGVELADAVPDLRPHLAEAAVVAVPVRFGTGMRGKVVEALAMARPLVTTSLGAEGLGGEAGRHYLVADDAAGFAAAVRRLLEDPAGAARLGAAGRELVVRRFDWDAIAAAHDDLYDAVLRDPGPAPAAPPRPAGPPAVARLGRLAALAAGAVLVGARGLRWHASRPRPLPPRLAVRTGAV